MTDPILRHAGSNIPGRVSPGNEQFRGTSPLAGHGVTLSCFRCGVHRPQHTYGAKARIFGALHHVCDPCKEQMAAKRAEKQRERAT